MPSKGLKINDFNLNNICHASSCTLNDHSNDNINVKDYGMKLDGVSDDTLSFALVKSQAQAGDTLLFPTRKSIWKAGLTPPTTNPDKINFWWTFGTTDSNGAPISSWGYDPVFNTVNNSFRFSRGANIPQGNGYLLRLDDIINQDGNPTAGGQITGAFSPTCSVSAKNLTDGVWCQSTVLTTYNTHGDDVAVAMRALRPNDALADGKGARTELWGELIQSDDETGKPAQQSGSLIGTEMDLEANGKGSPEGCASSSDCGNRTGMDLVLTTYKNGQAGYDTAGYGSAYNVRGHDDLTYVDRIYDGEIYYRVAGYDASRMTSMSVSQISAASNTDRGNVLHMTNTDAGLFVGMYVTGPGIPDPRASVLRISGNDVTISSVIMGAQPVGSLYIFSADAPAFKMNAGQFMGLDVGNNWRFGENSAGEYNLSYLGVNMFHIGSDGVTTINSVANSGSALYITGSAPVALDTSTSQAKSSLRMIMEQTLDFDVAGNLTASETEDGLWELKYKGNDIFKIASDGSVHYYGVQAQEGYTLQNLPKNVADGSTAYCVDCMLNGVQGVNVLYHSLAAKWTDMQNGNLSN